MKKTYTESVYFLGSKLVEEEFQDGMRGGWGRGSCPKLAIQLISTIFDIEETQVKGDFDLVLNEKRELLKNNWDLAIKGKHKF